jgi:hypothetical protein
MKEYRSRLGINSEATSQNDNINDLRNKPGYMSLAEVYGLGEDMIVGSGGQRVQSIDQEYSEYVSAVLSSSSVDILKFWEACIVFSLIVPSPDSCNFRSTAQPSLLCMLWRWIIFQSKHQLYHVRGYSPLVPRPTQSGAIGLVPCSWKRCRC